MKNFRRGTAIIAVSALAGLALAACGQSKDSGDEGSGLIVGTTDKVVSIDPAGSYDNGSLQIQTQVYQYLLNFPAGSTTLTPDAASKCDFDTPTTYVCTIKDGLKFANGNALTASDVAFSFKRIVKINDPNGPASLLTAMKSVEAKDDKTVVFTLNSPNDLPRRQDPRRCCRGQGAGLLGSVHNRQVHQEPDRRVQGQRRLSQELLVDPRSARMTWIPTRRARKSPKRSRS